MATWWLDATLYGAELAGQWAFWGMSLCFFAAGKERSGASSMCWNMKILLECNTHCNDAGLDSDFLPSWSRAQVMRY